KLTGWVYGPKLAPRPADTPLSDTMACVDTRLATHASADVTRGNTLPLTAMPNRFALFTPDTDARPARWLYEYHRANGPDNRPRLQAMALSHQPSPWMGDPHQSLMMPLLGSAPRTEPAARARGFDHDRETARPDLYEVELD